MELILGYITIIVKKKKLKSSFCNPNRVLFRGTWFHTLLMQVLVPYTCRYYILGFFSIFWFNIILVSKHLQVCCTSWLNVNVFISYTILRPNTNSNLKMWVNNGTKLCFRTGTNLIFELGSQGSGIWRTELKPKWRLKSNKINKLIYFCKTRMESRGSPQKQELDNIVPSPSVWHFFVECFLILN